MQSKDEKIISILLKKEFHRKLKIHCADNEISIKHFVQMAILEKMDRDLKEEDKK